MGNGKKIDLRKALIFALTEYKQWVADPKMILIAAFAVFIYQTVTGPLLRAASDVGKTLSVFEPVVAVGASGLIMLILPLLFLVIMSDFPSDQSNSFFSIVRIGRINWLLGQYILAFLCAITYQVFLLLVTVIPMIGRVKFDIEWSGVIPAYIENYPERSIYAENLLPKNLYNQLSLGQALIGTYLLLTLYLYVLALILLTASIYHHHFLGILLSGVVITAGTVFCALSSTLMWYFPMAQSIIWLHYTDYYRQQIFPITGTIVYFSMILLMFILWNFSAVKDFSFTGQGGQA